MGSPGFGALHEASASDIPLVAALMNDAFRGKGPVASWNAEVGYIDGDRTSTAMLEADLADRPEARLLVSHGEDGRTVIGCVWLEPSGADVWYLGSLAVDPALQNAGAGRALLEASEHRVRSLGGHRVRITVVNVRETLIAWYLRRGYRLTGETEPFPYDDHRFGIPQQDGLHFVCLEKAL